MSGRFPPADLFSGRLGGEERLVAGLGPAQFQTGQGRAKRVLFFDLGRLGFRPGELLRRGDAEAPPSGFGPPQQQTPFCIQILHDQGAQPPGEAPEEGGPRLGFLFLLR
jgi:hypothetical protein